MPRAATVSQLLCRQAQVTEYRARLFLVRDQPPRAEPTARLLLRPQPQYPGTKITGFLNLAVPLDDRRQLRLGYCPSRIPVIRLRESRIVIWENLIRLGFRGC